MIKNSKNRLPSLYNITYNKIQKLGDTNNNYSFAYLNRITGNNQESFNHTSNLLLRSIPEILSYYIKLHKFLHKKSNNINSYLDLDIHTLTHKVFAEENAKLIAKLSHDNDLSLEHIIYDMHCICVNKDFFISRINSYTANNISSVIEAAVNCFEKESATIIMGDPILKYKDLASLLISHGVGKNFIRKYFNLHYNNTILINAKTQKHKRRSNKRGPFICMSNKSKALYIMLMLNLYVIAYRSANNLKLSNKFLDFNDIKDTAADNIALISGAYFASSLLYKTINSDFNIINSEYFPSFEDFFEILELILQNKAKIIACLDCGTCYLEFAHNLLKNSSYNNAVKKITCPTCNHNQSFDLE